MVDTIVSKINLSCKNAETSESDARRYWSQVLQLIRLRVHEGYYLNSIVAALYVADYLSTQYPVLGGQMLEIMKSFIYDDIVTFELLQKHDPHIDITQPPRMEEKQFVLNIIGLDEEPDNKKKLDLIVSEFIGS